MAFTKAQQMAIDSSGDSLLVSAAAGSGKTTVLTERVIQMLINRRCEIDRLLILTFTEASATDMRLKISKALREAILKDPDNSLLRRQYELLPAAQISTIHSACLRLIRDNFETLELDPQFSVAEENRLELMRDQLLDEFIESIYEQDYSDIIDYFTKGRDDSTLRRVISECANFLSNEPYENLFFKRAFENVPENLLDSMEGKVFLRYAKDELSDIAQKYQEAVQTQNGRLREFLEAEHEIVLTALKSVDESNFDSLITSIPDKMNQLRKKKEDDEEQFERAKTLRTPLKDRLNAFKKEFLCLGNESTVIADRKRELEIIKQVFTLASRFNAFFFKKRKRSRLMSFDDIEKYTLRLLIENFDGENITKTKTALELSEKYDEIIVDEYQDCNRTQELIFRALSKDCRNLFTVGDVKQSIYGFRNAAPELFLQKQKNSERVTDCTLTTPSKLELSHNFRSHPEILRFVNRVFDTLMTEKRGGIDYADGHRLNAGEGIYPETDCAGVELNLVIADISKAEAEASAVAKKIKSLIGKEKIYDSKQKCERTLRASDIAILIHHPKKTGAVYEKALAKEGIECVNNNPSERFLDTPEVNDLLAFLQAIDNPYNDIPLVTVMYSDYFSFTSDELGAIRAKNKRMLFYDAVKEYAKTDVKCAHFVGELDLLRTLSLTSGVYGVINAIFETSGIFMRLSSGENGDTACANLQMLLDLALSFESERYRGLFSFVNYIIKLKEKSDKLPAAKLKKSDSCVSILSIHKSKGLEYPAVFLVDTAENLNRSGSDVIYAHSLGMTGTEIRDSATHREFSSFHRRVIKQLKKEERLYESIRVMYVALTRARTRMYIYASKDSSYKLETDRNTFGSSFWNWLVYSVGSEYPINVIHAESDAETESETVQTETYTDLSMLESISSRQYAYADSVNVPSKLSVSDIKGMQMQKSHTFKKPRFMQNGVTGTDRGNATHTFLQFCDFNAVKDQVSLEKEISRLTEYEFISRRDSELLEKDKILNFLTSDIMRRLSESDACYKEERFLFNIPANEVLDTESREEISVQGILDCLYVTNGKAVIVDYKTDRVKTEDELVSRYAVQLNMYERAVKVVRGLETEHKYIYSFCLEKFIEI